MVRPSHHRDAQNYYDLKKINVESSGPLTITTSKKCRVVWPSHHSDAQNYYDLEKINVEWSGSGPLTLVSPKNIMTTSITPKIITTSKK